MDQTTLKEAKHFLELRRRLCWPNSGLPSVFFCLLLISNSNPNWADQCIKFSWYCRWTYLTVAPSTNYLNLHAIDMWFRHRNCSGKIYETAVILYQKLSKPNCYMSKRYSLSKL